MCASLIPSRAQCLLLMKRNSAFKISNEIHKYLMLIYKPKKNEKFKVANKYRLTKEEEKKLVSTIQ